jgi:hypothetical protein
MMKARSNGGRRSTWRRLLAEIVLGVAATFAASPAASAATTATFSSGVLSVFGDSGSNAIVISRDAAGRILVNGGAIAVVGGTPTVANTSRVQVFGLGGNDGVSLNEANGALPAANLFGGPTTTPSPAAPAPTSSSGRPATTRSSGRARTTSCSAAPGTTSSQAATPTTRPSARTATTG